MPRHAGDFFAPSRPREARGGIKAASRRGEFAASWWGRRWIEVIESFPIGARLGRGKAYARKGQVLALDFDGGTIRARVQGSRAVPYKCAISLRPLDAGTWERALDALGSNAYLAAALLGGNVPPEIETVLGAKELSLFPSSQRDLGMECSCPDPSVPCKHLAAVFFLVAESIERDPFLLFELRGMPRAELLRRVGIETREEEEEAETPLPENPETFWQLGALPQPPGGEHARGALLRQLGPFPLWRGEIPVAEALTDVCETAAKHARSLSERAVYRLGEDKTGK